MPADVVTGSLLRIAAEDLAGAKLLAASGNRNAIYLCEQAAEKIIRAVLTAEGTRAGTTHLLNEMVDKVLDTNGVKPMLRGIQGLSSYATAYRYPTPVGRIPGAPDAVAFAEQAARVEAALTAVAAQLGVELPAKA